MVSVKLFAIHQLTMYWMKLPMFVNVQIISMRLTLWMKKLDVFAVRKAKSVVLIQGDSQNVQINVLKIMLQMQRVSFISGLLVHLEVPASSSSEISFPV